MKILVGMQRMLATARALAIGCLAMMAFIQSSSSANAETGALEWRRGGLFSNIVNPKAKRRLPRAVVEASAKKSVSRRKPVKARKVRGKRVGSRKVKAGRKSASLRTKRRSRGRKVPTKAKAKLNRPIRVASLGNSFKIRSTSTKSKPAARPKSLTGNSRGVTWVARAGCLNGRLKSAIYHVARAFGRVRVNSTCRSRRHNRRVGGARRSHHLTGNAADIRIWGNVRAAARYLRGIAGGYKHYGGGLFHIDTGPRRRW